MRFCFGYVEFTTDRVVDGLVQVVVTYSAPVAPGLFSVVMAASRYNWRAWVDIIWTFAFLYKRRSQSVGRFIRTRYC